MKESKKAVCQRMKRIVLQSEKDIEQLYVMPCIYARNTLLYELTSEILELKQLCNELNDQEGWNETSNEKKHRQTRQNQIELTDEELSQYNGKAGNPAYVAVNGIIYDVTNNAAWAAASHFGLTAGKDLTRAFASCHAGQTILNKLKIVGKLI